MTDLLATEGATSSQYIQRIQKKIYNRDETKKGIICDNPEEFTRRQRERFELGLEPTTSRVPLSP
jgi:hypothetical protein